MVCERKQEEFQHKYNESGFDIVEVYDAYIKFEILTDDLILFETRLASMATFAEIFVLLLNKADK